MSTVSASQSLPSGTQSFAYQEVDGLQEIYVGAEATPTASFVFASKAQADAAYEGVAKACNRAYMLGEGRQFPDHNLKSLLEILRSSNLSTTSDEKRVLSFSAKTGGTVGAPMETVEELLERVGKAMKTSSPSAMVNVVPIHIRTR